MISPTRYQRGDRVALVHTTYPTTTLGADAKGTVEQVHPSGDTVLVRWDNGAWIPMMIGQAGGDALHLVEPAPGAAADTSPSRWQELLEVARRVGAVHGGEAADQWISEALTGHTAAEAAEAASALLAGLADGDPGVLSTLPTSRPPRGAPSWYTARRHAEDFVLDNPDDLPAWSRLPHHRLEEATSAYRDSFDAAVRERAGHRARAAAERAGHGRGDLDRLHPDGLREGAVGVFATDWDLYPTDDGTSPDRFSVGYLATLVGPAALPAAFVCTRVVADALVAGNQQTRATLRQELLGAGATAAEATRQVDRVTARVAFDGDVLILDTGFATGAPGRRLRIEPDEHSGYLIPADLPGGEQIWRWQAVDPDRCDRLVGDLPDPGPQPGLVALTHAPGVRVPHTRLAVATLPALPTEPRPTHLGLLELDRQTVGVIWLNPIGDSSFAWRWLDDRFGAPRFAAYAQASRWRGQPLSAGDAMEWLVAEAIMASHVAEAEAAGGALARLVDDRGHIAELEKVWPAPQTPRARQNAMRQITGAHPDVPGTWQLWTGEAWREIPTTDDPVAEPTAPPVTLGDFTDAGLDGLDRDQLIPLAADLGVLLDPDMTEAGMRTALRAHLRQTRTGPLAPPPA